VTGGAIAILLYYAMGSLIFIVHLWGRSGVSAAIPRAVSSGVGTIQEDSPGRRLVGNRQFDHQSHDRYHHRLRASAGVATLAGYGTGARLEFLLVPLSYGIGGPAGIMIGTNIGAGRIDRALKVAWTTVFARRPDRRKRSGLRQRYGRKFGSAHSAGIPAVIENRFGLSQDGWPMFGFSASDTHVLHWSGHRRNEMAGCRRLCAGGGGHPGGLSCLHVGASVHWIFLSVAVGMASFGCLALPGLIRQSDLA